MLLGGAHACELHGSSLWVRPIPEHTQARDVHSYSSRTHTLTTNAHTCHGHTTMMPACASKLVPPQNHHMHGAEVAGVQAALAHTTHVHAQTYTHTHACAQMSMRGPSSV